MNVTEWEGASVSARRFRDSLYSLALPLFGLALLLAGGCSGGLVRIRGVVTADGTPVPDATVSFVPIFAGGHPVSGKTDSDGNFVLTTSHGEAILYGEYKVVVTPPNPKFPRQGAAKEDQGISPAEKLIPHSYRDAQTTRLRQVVPPKGELRLELTKDE